MCASTISDYSDYSDWCRSLARLKQQAVNLPIAGSNPADIAKSIIQIVPEVIKVMAEAIRQLIAPLEVWRCEKVATRRYSADQVRAILSTRLV